MAETYKPGSRNAITDVDGITVGQAHDEALETGVTVVTCFGSTAAAVDVRGGGPGTRETDALGPENLVHKAHAIVLTGGSVFGLAAADEVAWRLSQRGEGLILSPGARAIPIVPAAVLHDLGSGKHNAWTDEPPYRGLAARALEGCAPQGCGLEIEQGSVGAGRGAQAGLEKGGIGTASLWMNTGVCVGALMAANPVGSVRYEDGETFLATPWEQGGEFGGTPLPTGVKAPVQPDLRKLAAAGKAKAGSNTTIGVVATNALLSASECKRLAIMAQDGIARAVSPAHTHFDGDTIFAISTGTVALTQGPERALIVAEIGAALADCTARSIAKAVYHAQGT